MRPSTSQVSSAAVVKGLVPGLLGRLGERIVDIVLATLLFVGDLTLALAHGLRPGTWRRTMRAEFDHFFYLVGIRAIPAVVITAVLVGLGLVLQVIYWLELAAQEGSVGSLLVLLLIREISPLVTALIVIGRSGSVMLDEVGYMRVNGQIRMLESHGVDPIEFIAIPRCFATAAALFALNMIFLYAALWSGYVGASLAGLTATSLVEFADDVVSNMDLGDHLLLVVKPVVTGCVIGYLATWLGLRVDPSALGVRRALPRGFLYSLLATFLISIAVSAVM